MKKVIALLFVAVFLAVTTIGCGNGSTKPTGPSGGPSTTKP